MPRISAVLLLAVLLNVACAEDETTSSDPAAARIVTEDLDRFWVAWDAAAKADDESGRAAAFFEHYYLPASPGLRDFIQRRVYSVFHLLDRIDDAPEYYASLREHTPKAAEAAAPVRAAFEKLEALYPEAVFPDVYIMMGRMTSAGTIGPSGLLIGADMFGGYPEAPLHEVSDWHRSVLRPMEDLPYIIAHELVHYQQPELESDLTLLQRVFQEGSADFVAELIAGRHINHHVHEWAAGREREIWKRFAAAMHGRDLAGFLYGNPPDGWPADVGYYVGYRIAQAYYEQAEDKRAALADILEMRDVDALLDRSGYARRFEDVSPSAPAGGE